MTVPRTVDLDTIGLAATDPDSWIAAGLRHGGLGRVRRRKVAAHEAAHAAYALARGWDVSRAEIVDHANGFVEYDPPVARREARLQTERLELTIAPMVLLGGSTGDSGGDRRDGIDLARKIASPTGEACMAVSADVNR